MWNRLGEGFYCNSDVYDLMLAETTLADREAMAEFALRMQGGNENSLSHKYPNVKYMLPRVQGHKGTNNRLQVIMVQRADEKSYVTHIRDVAKYGQIAGLDELPEDEAEILRRIASGVSV